VDDTKVYPKLFIVGTTDLIEGYCRKVEGILNPVDLNEIITQIISMLLNDDSGIIEYGDSFPDYTRLHDTSFLNNEEKIKTIEIATHELVVSIYNKLKEVGLFCDKTFPYFFDKFLDRDIVLHHLPF